MGLLDIFKKKEHQTKKETPCTENVLEAILKKASKEPAFRNEFYKSLLSEELVILTNKNGLSEGRQVLATDTSISIVKLPNGKIPVFTSTSRIFDKGVIKEQVQFLAMKGQDLFNLAKGATFLLNPYSDHGKELLPAEIESMLKGILSNAGHKSITIEKSTQVQIGQPSTYPIEIINSLKVLFSNRPAVKNAYLGWIFDPSAGEPPHYIFGLDIEGEKQTITREAGFTAKQYLNPEDLVDFIQIDNNGGLSDYFLKQVTPFYKR